MGRIIGWLIGITLVVLVNFVSIPIHDFLESRARPPAPTPDRAPYPISAYGPARVESAVISDNDKTWTYEWDMTTSASLEDVVAYYNLTYPNTMEPLEDDDPAYLAVAPRVFKPRLKGASSDEAVTIVVRRDDKVTRMELREEKLRSGFVPGQGTIRLALWVLILLGFVALRAGLAEMLARFFMARKMAAGGTKFELLPDATQDRTVLTRWEVPQKELEAAGFTWVGDCRMEGASFPHCIRLMQRHHQTFASLVYLVPSGEAAFYCELFTPFTDGTTVTTTSSRFGSNFKRPSDYALDVLPPDTRVPDLLAHHDAAVSSKAGRVRDVMTVASVDDLFALWRQVEQALHEYRKKAGFLTEDAAKRVQDTGSLLPNAPPAGPSPTPKASPPQVKLAATEERQVEFRTQMAEAIQEAYPDLQLVEKAPLVLEGRYRDWHDTLDLEKPFAGYLDDPVRKSFIIASYVSNLGTALGHGKDGG